MGKRKAAGGKRTRRQLPAGQTARASGQTLKSWSVGALPIVNKILQRLKLEEFLRDGLPAEDRRTKVPTASALLVLLRNLLLSREPLYGIGEWAAGHAPDLLGLTPEQVAALNDDRVGRSLDRLFDCDTASLALAVVGHAVGQFGVSLDDCTTTPPRSPFTATIAARWRSGASAAGCGRRSPGGTTRTTVPT